MLFLLILLSYVFVECPLENLVLLLDFILAQPINILVSAIGTDQELLSFHPLIAPPCIPGLSWKCRHFRCRPQLVLMTWCGVFLTRRPDTADVLCRRHHVMSGSFFLCCMWCHYLIADMSWIA